MKLPALPPSWAEDLTKLPPQRLSEIVSHAAEASKRDRYLHWDDLRRREAPYGFSQREWWIALKLGRQAKLRPIPLRDKKGGPFLFATPDSVLEQLHEIDRGLGFAFNLPAAVTNAATRDHYLISSLMQESITSSQLEGAATTREIAKEMLRTGRPPRDNGERMILNNYNTMRHIQSMRDAALEPGLVLEIHRRITADTLDRRDAAGRLRLPAEKIRVEGMDGTIFHDPPEARQLPERLAAMCAFANGGTPDFFVHPVVRAIILHFWLAYDHPFVDGNGRTARALFYWSMLRQGYQLFEFISISQILLRAPSQYGMSFLHTETDGNDLTYFILYQAEVIREAVKALHDYAAHKASELRQSEKRLRGLADLNHRQQALLAHALREPTTRYIIEGHRRSHGVTFQTARNDLFKLVERGLLTSSKEGRYNVFRAPADLGDKLAKLADTPRPSPSPDQTLPLKFPGAASIDP